MQLQLQAQFFYKSASEYKPDSTRQVKAIYTVTSLTVTSQNTCLKIDMIKYSGTCAIDNTCSTNPSGPFLQLCQQ